MSRAITPWIGGRRAAMGRKHAARSSGAAFVETKASPEALKAIKRKDDARISLQKSVNALFKDFEAADTDSDGLLAVEEIEVYGKRTW